MNYRILIAVTLGLSAATAFAADRSFERTLSVPSTPVVSVYTGSGFVHMHPGSDSQIHVSAHLRANAGWMGGGNDVAARMQQIVNHPPIQQNGGTVTIGERNHDDLYRNIAIDYDVALPHASSITADTGSGEITVQDVGTSVNAETGSGNVAVHGSHGAVSLQAGSGDIVLDGSASGETQARTGSGSIRLSGVTGGLQVMAGSGDVTIGGNPTADWRLQTGSGTIHLDLGASAHFTLNASTGSGSINVAQPLLMQGSMNRRHVSGSVNGGGPNLRAQTGSGSIEIR